MATRYIFVSHIIFTHHGVISNGGCVEVALEVDPAEDALVDVLLEPLDPGVVHPQDVGVLGPDLLAKIKVCYRGVLKLKMIARSLLRENMYLESSVLL